jgi:hypothetical protein
MNGRCLQCTQSQHSSDSLVYKVWWRLASGAKGIPAACDVWVLESCVPLGDSPQYLSHCNLQMPEYYASTPGVKLWRYQLHALCVGVRVMSDAGGGELPSLHLSLIASLSDRPSTSACFSHTSLLLRLVYKVWWSFVSQAFGIHTTCFMCGCRSRVWCCGTALTSELCWCPWDCPGLIHLSLTPSLYLIAYQPPHACTTL